MDRLFFEKPFAEAVRLFQIIAIVRARQRHQPRGRGVLPVTISVWLDEYRAQQTVRRYCVELWEMGIFERVGANENPRSRRGYRLAV